MNRKTSSELVETILAAKKLKPWVKAANLISVPRRKRTAVNLDEIDKETKEGDTVLIPGKVLSQGELSKKVRVVAFSFSDKARKKLKESKCEIVSVKEEIKVNPKFQGVKILN